MSDEIRPAGPAPFRREKPTPPDRTYPRTFDTVSKNDVFGQIYESNPIDREFFKANDAAGKKEFGNANALYGPNAVGGNNFQYPSDLGSQEYNHFVLFSIYQGQSVNLSSENVEMDNLGSYQSAAGGNSSPDVAAAEDRRADQRSSIIEDSSRDSGGPGMQTSTYRAGGRGSGRGRGARRNPVQQTRINPARVRMMETVALYMPQKLNQLGILDYDIEATTGAAIIKDLSKADMKALSGLGQGAINAATKFFDGVANAFGVEDTGFNPALRASMRITSNPRR